MYNSAAIEAPRTYKPIGCYRDDPTRRALSGTIVRIELMWLWCTVSVLDVLHALFAQCLPIFVNLVVGCQWEEPLEAATSIKQHVFDRKSRNVFPKCSRCIVQNDGNVFLSRSACLQQIPFVSRNTFPSLWKHNPWPPPRSLIVVPTLHESS